MLLDSNIIIYAAQADHADLRRLIAEHAPAVSAVSVVEVLGFHRLLEVERQHFEQFFANATVLPLSDSVIYQATKLRQRKRMTLGDALVASTALVHSRRLVTRNAKHFAWISELQLLNPFEN
jgi:toxin FitB